MSESAQTLYPAATVVLVRDHGDAGARHLETLMLRRNEHGDFGGMWVFPGGRVDESDLDPAAPGDEMAAGRRAAAREAFEEAGVLVDPATFLPLSHWRPPTAAARRGYSTWFFVAAAPDDDINIDGVEIHEHAWLTPAEVLRRRDAGDVTLVPPTFVTLTLLAHHASVSALLADVASRTPERYHTQLGLEGDTKLALWHGDERYEGRPGRPGARHRLVMADDGWRYVRSP